MRHGQQCRPATAGIQTRRLRARSPRTVSVTYCDGDLGPDLGCRGTTRGTSTGRIPVQCVLSVRPRVSSVQVERLVRPRGPLLIRGFRVRAPGAPPGKHHNLQGLRGTNRGTNWPSGVSVGPWRRWLGAAEEPNTVPSGKGHVTWPIGGSSAYAECLARDFVCAPRQSAAGHRRKTAGGLASIAPVIWPGPTNKPAGSYANLGHVTGCLPEPGGRGDVR